MARERTLTVFQPIPVVTQDMQQVFGGPLTRLFPDARSTGLETVRLELRAGLLHHDVDLQVGPVWSWGDAQWRSLHWIPHVERGDVLPADELLPSFIGEVGLQFDQSSLVLTGSYVPPFGPFGAILDSAVMAQVAHRCAKDLLARVAEAVTQSVPAAG